MYRITVSAGGRDVGFAEVDVVNNGSQLRQNEEDIYIPLLDGRTLPIKFSLSEPARFHVDASGGTVSSSDSQARFALPAGALAGPTLISVDPAADACDALPGTTYAMWPGDVVLSAPGIASITYQDSDVPAGELESELTLLRVTAEGCEDVVGASVDPATNTVSGPFSAFGSYAIGLKTRSIAVSPAALTLTVLGDSVSLTASARSQSGVVLQRVVRLSGVKLSASMWLFSKRCTVLTSATAFRPPRPTDALSLGVAIEPKRDRSAANGRGRPVRRAIPNVTILKGPPNGGDWRRSKATF